MQGISFKIGDYKYKGSDVDRKFSINHLQKFFYKQRVKDLLRRPNSKYAHLLPQRSDSEIKNVKDKGRDLFNLLMKIEKNERGNDADFQFRKKKRRI